MSGEPLFAQQKTAQGFTRVSLPQIIASLEALWKGAYGSSVDLDPRSADGQMIGGIAEMMDDLNSAVADLMHVANPNGATGAFLTNIAALTNVTRNSDEKDANLRIRRQQATATASQSMSDTLLAALLALPGVLDACVRENATSEPGLIGGLTINPNTVRAVVEVQLGGAADPATTTTSTDPIANTIFALKSMGCGTQGGTGKGPLDALGVSHDIYYDLATALDVQVAVTISTRTNWPSDGGAQIAALILGWANGTDPVTGKPNCPISGIELTPGSDQGALSWTDVVGSFLGQVPGFDFVSLTFSLDGGATWSTNGQNLVIPFTRFASISSISVVAE